MKHGHTKADEIEITAQKRQHIQIAHDLIIGIILGELPSPYPASENERLSHYAEALCWILGHRQPGSAGNDFSDALVEMSDYVLAAAGRKHERRHRVN